MSRRREDPGSIAEEGARKIMAALERIRRRALLASRNEHRADLDEFIAEERAALAREFRHAS